MIKWEGCGRKRSWPNFKALSQSFPGEAKKTTKTLIQDSRSRGGNLNPGPPEYEAGRSVTVISRNFFLDLYD
jgi:hypothetical protein